MSFERRLVVRLAYMNSTNGSSGFRARVQRWREDMLARFVPPHCVGDPETLRRAHLITGFGFLGAAFGPLYALFYLCIGHYPGSIIVTLCSSGVALTPFVMRRTGSTSNTGNLVSLLLVLGFSALSCVEGGLHGHAIAWLVSVPLCSLLLVGKTAARCWAMVSFLCAGLIGGLAMAGYHFDTTYDPSWNSVVSVAGYLGLIVFMFLLGSIFESGRAEAFETMQQTLGKFAVSNDRLTHLNQEKNEFLSIAAHDLKNPLTVVISSAELLGLTQNPAQIARLAGAIFTTGTRMRDLITNLLDANAIEEGRFTSNLESCDLRVLVEQSIGNNQSAAARKEISLQTGFTEGLCAHADKNATLQILDNLLSNAVKYSPPRTTIRVHTMPETGHVLVAIRDEGPGISAEDQQKLFRKFTRLSARPTGGESSNGLGLSIVKRLAEAMHGSVHCQSKLGAGTTFTLRLPIGQAVHIALPLTDPKPTEATTQSFARSSGRINSLAIEVSRPTHSPAAEKRP